MGSRGLIIFTLAVAYYSQTSEALRILGIFPLAGHSHFVTGSELMRGLARRGHQVDVITHFPRKQSMPNYKDISLAGTSTFTPLNNISYNATKDFGQFSMSKFVQMTGLEPCNLLSHDVMQEFFKTPKDTYDVVIVEVFAAQCYLAFGQHFKAPLVGIVVSKMHDWLYEHFGIPFNTAYIPSLFSSYSQDMTFRERLQNTLLSSIIIPQIDYYMNSMREHVEKYFGRKLTSISELYKDVSVLLVNSHHSFNDIIPTTPGVIEVGGLHVHDDQQQLSPEIKKWLDESKHGFIYVSFGSMIRLETFPEEIVAAFYEMFRSIAPVRVLMKIADAKILPPGLPKNVKTSPWLPQVAVLKHDNIKLFISHGGLMSTQEAVAYAVPIVGIPIFGDQRTNIQTCQRKKIAVALQVEDITVDSLTNAVNTILKDSTYSDNMKRVSKLFHDRPMTAMDTAIYWVEYAARNGKVLQSPAIKLTWWQYYLLDVYGFILLCIFIVLYVVKKLLTLLWRLTCSRKKKQEKPSKLKTK